MNIKVYLPLRINQMSQYTCESMLAKSPRKLEIAFMYGGSFYTINDTLYIHIRDFIIPKKQNLSHTTFKFCSLQNRVPQYFKEKNMRIVGLGHSHSNFDIFHSDDDLRGLQATVIGDGFVFPKKEKFVFKNIYAYIFDMTDEEFENLASYKSKSIQKGNGLLSFIYNGIQSTPEYKFAYKDSKFQLHLVSIQPQIIEENESMTHLDKQSIDAVVTSLERQNRAA